MSLIVDVLKRAQKDAVSIKPPPPFIEYPYKKDLSLKAIISRHVWLFSGATGFGIIMLFMVLMMTMQGGKSTPEAGVFYKPVERSQKFFAVLPEVRNLQEKSASGQKEKTRIIEPEKRITAPSPEGKKMKSENDSGNVLLKKSSFHDVMDQFYLALSHQKRGEKEKAIEGYRKIIEMDPMNVEAHTNLGVIYKDMGKLVQAVKEFQMVLSMNPRHEKAHNNLGVIFYLQGNLKKAIQEFREVLDINPSNKEAFINLGVIYKKVNQTSKAKKMFENALSIDLHSPEAHYNLGLIYEESRDIKEAISCYRKFIDFSGSTYPELTAKVKSRLEMLSQSQR
jgi:Tfp pilus assembly protein PilF